MNANLVVSILTGLAIVSFELFSSASVDACNIPVFRYALERWQQDQYEIVVFHEGELSKQVDQASFTKSFEAFDHANCRVTTYDVAELKDDKHGKLWQSISDEAEATFPYVVVLGQRDSRVESVVWLGKMTAFDHFVFAGSPARHELADRLLRGDSIVWLFIPGDDPDANKAIRSRLQNKLTALESEMEFPDGIGLPGSELYSEVPLLMQFSILDIDRNAIEECGLLRLLGLGIDESKMVNSVAATQSGDGVKQAADGRTGPTLAPVFGRGRVLQVLHEADFDEDLVEAWTRYLVASCSCQVKEQNPGFDLLMTIDWRKELFGERSDAPPGDESRDRRPTTSPKLLAIPPGRNRS